MNWTRREFVWSVAGLAAAADVNLEPARAAAAINLETAGLESLLANSNAERSADVRVEVPIFVESGERVSVSVATTLPDVESISLIVEKNTRPWAVTFNVAAPMESAIRTQIRVEKSSDIIALVRTRGSEKSYYASADVIVTSADGCP